jgi:diguanylate cyclase (GGDEF)-like protein
MIVLTAKQDNAELINRTLRDAGYPARCQWVQRTDTLAEVLDNSDAELLWLFADDFPGQLREIGKLRQHAAQNLPLIVVQNAADEAAIGEAMQAGAQDLVSTQQLGRLLAVAERELRSFRLEHALNETLRSASQYKKQLKAFVADSVDAIAHVQEGIVVEANQAWAELFKQPNAEAVAGPLMDQFDESSQAALKGALVACGKGRWDAQPLKLTAIAADGSKVPLGVLLQNTQFEGEPAVKLSVPRREERTEQPEQVVEQALHNDPSTGVYHRRRFVELLTDRLDNPPRSGVRALAYIRPDKFGEIEEEVGPLASEDVLVQMAEVLLGLAHTNDLCGRFGGTVFTILIERGTLRDIEAWAEHALSRIAEHIFEAQHNTLSLSCTIGLAEIGPGSERIETLLADAKRANQRGRKRGGNQVVLEETSDESTRIQRFDALRVQEIKSALVENRFRLVHLPIASLTGSAEKMFDTVLRMLDVQGDEVGASEFMAAAARNRLLRAIDRWVVSATVQFCAQQPCDCVFIKLSHESLIDKTLPEWIVTQAKARKTQPARICFEVSEEDATQYLKQTAELAERLRGDGFKFAVEHFGIGRNSLRVLTQTPMDYLKIDGSLMESLSSDNGLQSQVRGFVQEAGKRKIQTIAERIEDANTMAVLFQLGVGYMQGHYLQEPEVVLEENL